MKQIISKSIFLITLVSVFAIVFSSCSTSESVVNNGFLQKRKYNKGFHKSIKKNHKRKVTQESEVLVFNNTEVSKIESTSKEISEESNNSEVAKENVQAEEFALVTIKENTPIKEEVPVKENKVIETISKTVNKVKAKVNKDVIINKTSNTTDTSADDMFILIVILAFLIPPLAVGIYTNIDWLKVLIALLLWSSFFANKFLISLAIIYALLVIFDIL